MQCSAAVLAFHEWPTSERPRERLQRHGVDSLSDAELVALVLGSATRSSGGVLETSRRLLAGCGGLQGLARASLGELIALSGVGVARASALLAVVELGRRLWSTPVDRGAPLSNSRQVFDVLRGRLAGQPQEVFVVLALDARHRLLTLVDVAKGSATSVEVHPREVFSPLVRERAAAGIVAHNHPSGDPEPSSDDRELTQRLLQVGRVLGIPLLDHLIVGHGRYVSFADRGLL